MPQSLRARLIVGVLVLVALAIWAVSAITYLALKSFLIGRVDGQLRSLPQGLASNCERFHEHGPPPPIPILVARLKQDGSPDQPCPDNGYQRPLQLSAQDGARLTGRVGVPMNLRGLGDGPPVRAIALPAHVSGPDDPGHGAPDDVSRGDGPPPGGGPGHIPHGGPVQPPLAAPPATTRTGGFDVVGLSLGEVDGTLDRLLVLELIIGAIALVGAGAAGATGVTRGLQPLTEVTRTARTVAGEVSSGTGGLQRRVPEGEPGTEVGRLADAFNTMLTAVQVEVAARQDSEHRMRQFLADASHELRTPLTSLRGYAELITMRERREGVERDPQSADGLRRISEEGARMSRLVEDLLVLARSDGSEARRDEEVAVKTLAGDAAGDLRAAHPGREISVDAEPGCVVRGDPDQLRRVLINLLANAAVHTAGGVRLRVSRTDGQVRITIADDGPGLTPQQAAHVFDRFWRADSARTRAKGGSGLGLAIVDTLVSGHGGTIDFDTSPAAGTTVTVSLPAAP